MTATKYFLAPNARWQGRDQTGQPIINGKLYTYENGTVVPKATYQDKDGSFPNTNPVILDGKGEANIYWADDNLYTIKLYNSSNVLVYTQNAYPYVSNNQDTPVDSSVFKSNLVRNPQFTFWSNGTDFPAITANQTNYDYCADDWLYSKTDATSVVEIKRMDFDLGQVEVPGNPVNYLRYICSNIGGGAETNSHLFQRFTSVQTLSGKTVFPSIALKCVGVPSATVEIYLYQNFGTGGSPSAQVSKLAISATLSTSWQVFTPLTDIELASVDGKNIGSDNNDALIYSIKFPSNQSVTIDVANAQLIEGNEDLGFQYLSQDDQYKRVDSKITERLFNTGDVKFTLRTVADAGWLMCNDGTIGNPASGANTSALYTKALYKLIWDNVNIAYAPIFTSAGAPTTKGASAELDFNAGKRLALTKTLGRVIGTAGQGHVAQTFTAATGSAPAGGTLTISDSSSFYYAVPVTLTTTGTLPAGLSLLTTYYVGNVDSTHIKLATTPQNAIDGIYVAITDTGTGTHTVTINYTNWTLGQFIGEEKHGQIESEVASHSHPPFGSAVDFNYKDASGDSSWSTESGHEDPVLQASSTGFNIGSTPFNIMQPTTFLNTMIKL